MHFKEKLPLHYADFHKSIPLSDYHSMDGEFNLVSKLPDTMNIPDLGPKMYVAHGMAHNWSPVGTTSLHLDMADAVNILVHVQDPSSSKSSGNNNGNSPPSSVVGAVWDIFPQDSLSVLRAFLKQECPDDYTDDPVHDQIIFLNRGLLRKLYNTHGIRPWRLYQRPGTAIFVPAGCAHQVYNLAHCVKVAVDFVSPEHVGACVRIMNEFRLLPRGHARKQDLLQIKAILWHAWKSFDSDGMIDKAAAKEEAEKAVEEIRRRRLNGGGVVGLDVSEYAPPPAFSSIRSSSSLSLSYVRPVSAPTSTSTTLAAVGEEGKEDGGASTRAVKSSKRRVKSANHALSSSSTAKTMAAKTSIAPLHKKPAIGGAVSGGNGKLSAGGGVVNYSNSDVEEEDEILTEDEEARVMARGSGSGSGTSKLVFPASSSSDTTRTTTTSWNARLLSPTKPITAPKLNRAKLSSTASIKPAALKGNEEVNGSIPPHLSPLPRAPPSDPHRSIAPPTTQESQSHLGQNDTTANTNDVICNGDEQLGEGKNDEDDLEDLENDLGGYGEGLNLIDGYFK